MQESLRTYQLVASLEVREVSKKLDSRSRRTADFFTVVHLINQVPISDRATILSRAEDLGYLPSGKKVVLVHDMSVSSQDQIFICHDLEADLRDEVVEMATRRFGHRSLALEALTERSEEVERSLGAERRGREIRLVQVRA